MKIEIDLDYDEWQKIRRCVARHLDADDSTGLICAIDSAIENENERRGVAHAEAMLESGGVDDSKYRRDMIDAGRGHLIR
jgi:hypothetical protein